MSDDTITLAEQAAAIAAMAAQLAEAQRAVAEQLPALREQAAAEKVAMDDYVALRDAAIAEFTAQWVDENPAPSTDATDALAVLDPPKPTTTAATGSRSRYDDDHAREWLSTYDGPIAKMYATENTYRDTTGHAVNHELFNTARLDEIARRSQAA